MTQKILVCLFALLVAGCSSKPELSDIQSSITEGWKECPFVRPVNFKRLNGIEKGKTYVMTVSYDLEFLHDFKDPVPGFVGNKPCARLLMSQLAGKVEASTLKKGYLLPLGGDFEMVKSENGWIQE